MSAALAPGSLPEAAPQRSHAGSPTPVSELLAKAREAHTRGHLREAAEAYRTVLFAAPAHPAALLGLSLIARQTSQPQAALRMAHAAVAAGSRSAPAWSNLGDILLACVQDESIILPKSDIRSPAQNATRAAALNAFKRALALDPSLHAAHFGLGNLAAQQDNFATALTHFAHAAKLAPHRADLAFALAYASGKLGRHRDAIHHYRRAITLHPRFASAWLNLGVELVADGRDLLAPACYAQAIQAARKLSSDPLSTELSAHLNLGHLARSRRHFHQAQASYQRAAMYPHRLVEVHMAFAYLHLEQERFPQAWVSLRAAEQRPEGRQNIEVLNTRGILLLAEHAATIPHPYAPLVEEAIVAFTQAEALGHKTAPSNRANALLRLGRVSEALEAHKTALRLDPGHPGVRYNLALTQLRAGNFAEGWPNYEIRWDFREIHPRPRRFAQPRWFGEPSLRNTPKENNSGSCSPKFSSEFPQHSGLHSPETQHPEPAPQSPVLFLYAEQGLGDTLQFVRYLPLIIARLPGVSIVLEVQPPVLHLLQQSLAGLPIQLIASGEPPPPFTQHCPLMSLPAVFATTLPTVPANVPYLRAPAMETVPTADNVSALSIGIHWAGNPRYRADRERSTTLDVFRPLLALAGIRWVSLQKGPAARQIDPLPPALRPIDSGSSDADLADTARTIAALDLVITTDSAVAHLAGALAKPVWLLLPWQSDWRWMQETEATPWYPTMRLIRQKTPGDWPGLIDRVRQALIARLNAALPPTPNEIASTPPPAPRPNSQSIRPM
jgi:tetratricopeptide (TPR) repeat protein